MKAILLGLQAIDNINHTVKFSVKFLNVSTNTFDTDFIAIVTWASFTDTKGMADGIQSMILSEATTRGYSGFSASDILWFAPNQNNKLSFAAVATSGDYADLINKPISALSFSAASRSLNSAFQVSSTRGSLVNYSIDISTSVSLSGGEVGTAYLEYADDSGFTTNVVEVGRFVNGNTGTLVIGLTLNQTNTASVGGIVPAGKYVRIRTQNNTGTPTFTYRSGQEVLLASN